MTSTVAKRASTPIEDTSALIHRLGESFASKASEFDATDGFVAENYEALRASGLLAAAVPAELGGLGMALPELCDMLRRLAHYCGSTALAFSMHTHQVAIPAWRWRHQKVAIVEPLLKRVVAENLILLSSGGSDWIAGSGKAVKVEGGYRISARKIFTSGAPAGNILMTGATVQKDGEPDQVIHFGVPMKAPEVKILDTWHAMGMRGTGSHDVLIEGLFIPDSAVAMTRKAGEWHPVFQIISTVAFPLIYAVYLGVAESARDIAIGLAKKRMPTHHVADLAGRMETQLRGAQMAHQSMIAAAERNAPSAESVNDVMIGRALVADHALKSVELAMELAGGACIYRANGLERRFRDIQGARFHPLQSGPQAQYAGSIALGLPVATVF
ncbi:MAG: acyl-CoA dehydrogenase family protein [Rhizobiales bacterium]|nr:acyl-CoA dehydrogenase family protein [Hyphomicrobiales bacterium]